MKLHEIFEKVVREKPHEIAVKFQEKQYTYQQINEEANKLANHLEKQLPKDINGQPTVGVYLNSSENPLIAMLAISKLGGIYLPLSPGGEAANLETICKNTPPHMVIYETPLNLDKLNLNEKCVKVCLDHPKIQSEIKLCNQGNLEPITTPDEDLIAYYIYSSGTTGAPKCIPIAHRGLGKWARKLETLQDDSKRAVLNHIALSFDAHIWEYIMAWSLHAPICIAEDAIRGNKDPAGLAKFIAKHNITDVTIVPTILNPIIKLKDDELACKNNKLNIYCTGEAVSREIIETCLNFGWEFHECYGPTEATFGFTTDRIKYITNDGRKSAEGFSSFNIQNSTFEGFDAQEGIQRNDVPPIGKPYNDEIEVFILDENNQMITDGRPGQLAYYSPDMTKGYINNEKDNKEKFAEIEIPGREQPLRVHLTGDMFAQQNDHFYCLGRIGSSAKISGAFFEGKGIEETIRKINDITDVKVIKVYGNPERIVTIYTANADTMTPEAIRKELKKTFQKPVPIILCKIERMPTTESGKINQKELEKIAKETKRDTPSTIKPATTQLQKELVALWANLLQEKGIEEKDIQISDDFGFLGGNSSDRNLLSSEIKKQYNVELDAATLWGDDFNIEHLAELIEYEKFKPVILKKSEQHNNPSLFLFPSITGDGPSEYGKLCAELKQSGVEQAVYAFKAPGLIDSAYTQLSIQQLIDHYHKQLKKTQPKGPYYLGGWSSGALIAYGVAQKLKENGDGVHYLALIDEIAPSTNRNSHQKEKFAKELFELLKHLPVEQNHDITLNDLLSKSCSEQVNFVFEKIKPKNNIQKNPEDTLVIVKAFLLKKFEHVFKPMRDLDVYVFYTDTTKQNNLDKQNLNWDQFGKVTSTRVGENHFSPILYPTEISKQIAAQIKKVTLCAHPRRSSQAATERILKFSTLINTVILEVCKPENYYNTPLALELLNTLINCYTVALHEISTSENTSDMKTHISSYKEVDIQFWLRVHAISEKIRNDIKPKSKCKEDESTLWVRDIRKTSSSYLRKDHLGRFETQHDSDTEPYNVDTLFKLNEKSIDVSVLEAKKRAQNWASILRSTKLNTDDKDREDINDGYESDNTNSGSDTAVDNQHIISSKPLPDDTLTTANSMFAHLSNDYPLEAFTVLSNATLHYWDRIKLAKPDITAAPNSPEAGSNLASPDFNKAKNITLNNS